ncbi:hypothetical protein ACQX0A_11950, partial [Corynebacterium diphtheriae]
GDLRLLSPAADGTRVPGSLLDKVEAPIDLSPWQVERLEQLRQELQQATQAQQQAQAICSASTGAWPPLKPCSRRHWIPARHRRMAA